MGGSGVREGAGRRQIGGRSVQGDKLEGGTVLAEVGVAGMVGKGERR